MLFFIGFLFYVIWGLVLFCSCHCTTEYDQKVNDEEQKTYTHNRSKTI